jgi:hypothetical protein
VIDVEDLLGAELDRLLPAVSGPDWAEVLRLAGTSERRRRRATLVGTCAILAAAAAAIVLATPLGAAIARSFGGFSAWISGQPGSPAPKAQQRAFAHANAHSFLGFPAGTQLRLLETAKPPSGQRQVQLLGFRAGGTLCLRIVVTGKSRASRQSCAPLAELRHAGAPVRVVIVDDGFGQGPKRAWYGIDRVGAPALQITAGITADGVKAVTLHDNAGTHTVPAVSNGFLYVAWNPIIGQRVDAISAHTGRARVDVPFAPAPWGGVGGGGRTGAGTATGPTKVQRVLRTGTIGWLIRHQPVGQPLSALQGRASRSLRNGIIFGRLLNPNPNIPARFALTLSKPDPHAPFPALRAHGAVVCGWTFAGSGAGGGCSPVKGLFSRGPISAGTFLANGSDEFMLVSGFVSDDVHRLVAYLSTGDTQQVAVVHNAFLASIARARFPIRLVAYDAQGRIVGLTSPLTDIGGGAGPAPGRAKPLLHVTAPNSATATLLVGRSNQGGLCTYVRYYQSRFAQGASINCMGRAWKGSPVQLGGGGSAGIWYGRVRADVARVEVTFGDGAHATIHPTNGAILYAVPPSEAGKNDWVRRFTGYNAHGRAMGSEILKKPAIP